MIMNINIEEELQKEISSALDEHWAGAPNHPKVLARSIYRIVNSRIDEIQKTLPEKYIFTIVISYTDTYDKTVKKLIKMLREIEAYIKIILTSPETEANYESAEVNNADIYIDLNDQIEDEDYFDRFINQKETTLIIGIGFASIPDTHILNKINHSFYLITNDDIKQIFLQEYVYNLVMNDYLM